MTIRQIEVLWAIAEYGGNRQAADKLGISEQTVKNIVSDILKRLNARSALQAYHMLSGGRRVRTVTITTYEEEPE